MLVMTVYAAAVSKPGHGNTAPLAIGLSLYAAALTGAPCGWGGRCCCATQPRPRLCPGSNAARCSGHDTTPCLEQLVFARVHCNPSIQRRSRAQTPSPQMPPTRRRALYWRVPQPCAYHRPRLRVCLQCGHLFPLHLCRVLWRRACGGALHLPVRTRARGPRRAGARLTRAGASAPAAAAGAPAGQAGRKAHACCTCAFKHCQACGVWFPWLEHSRC